MGQHTTPSMSPGYHGDSVVHPVCLPGTMERIYTTLYIPRVYYTQVVYPGVYYTQVVYPGVYYIQVVYTSLYTLGGYVPPVHPGRYTPPTHPGYTPYPACARCSTGSSGLGAASPGRGALGSNPGIIRE